LKTCEKGKALMEQGSYDRKAEKRPNTRLHQTGIPLHFIQAGERDSLAEIMKIVFQSLHEFPPGTAARLLSDAYAGIESSDPEFWIRERVHWIEYDRQIYEFPTTIGDS
jgi:hypothetical protein